MAESEKNGSFTSRKTYRDTVGKVSKDKPTVMVGDKERSIDLDKVTTLDTFKPLKSADGRKAMELSSPQAAHLGGAGRGAPDKKTGRTQREPSKLVIATIR